MRRALAQLFAAPAGHGTGPWWQQLGAAGGTAASRSAGETSTSYASGDVTWLQRVFTRCMSGKGAKAKAKAAPAAPPPAAPTQKTTPAVLLSAGQRLRRKRPAVSDPLALLSEPQRALAQQLVPRQPSAPKGEDAGPPGPAPLRGLGQLGPPLDRRDVASLMGQALGGAAGQVVAFQPFVFSDVFQSAPALASYVSSALEGGTQWPRVERFLLAALEAEGSAALVRGIRVQVKGRLSRKNNMAACKAWTWGEVSGRNLGAHVDYGAGTALTRMGVLGIKVWIRYKPSAVTDVFYPQGGGSHYRAAPATAALPSLSLDNLYSAAAARTTRVALPYSFATVAWWERTALQQPQENGVVREGGDDGTAAGVTKGVFVPEYDPAATGERLGAYLQRRREEQRRFRTVTERMQYMATTGRFLRKQQRAAAAAAAAISGDGAAALVPTAAAGGGAAGAVAVEGGAGASAAGWPVMGRRRGVGVRPLARFRLEDLEEDGGVGSRRMGPAVGAVLRHRLKAKADKGPKKGGKEGKGKEGKSTVKGETEPVVQD